MITRPFLLFLSVLLTLQPAVWAQAGGSAEAETQEAARIAKLKKQAIAIPAGTTIRVRLTTGEKIEGAMGDISDEGFILHGEGGPQLQRTILFSELKSVQERGPSIARPLAKTAILAGVMAGVIALAATQLR